MGREEGRKVPKEGGGVLRYRGRYPRKGGRGRESGGWPRG